MDSENVILSFILLLTSGIAYFKIAKDKPFYTFYAQKVIYSINLKVHYLTTFILFCTNILLFVSKILLLFDYNDLDGNLEIWIVGVILYTLYELFYKDDYAKLLMTKTDSITDFDNVIQKINFFLELTDKQESNKAYGILLKGYIFHHEETCDKKDCSLKILKNQMSEESDLQENKDSNKTALLMGHCNQMYEAALQR